MDYFRTFVAVLDDKSKEQAEQFVQSKKFEKDFMVQGALLYYLGIQNKETKHISKAQQYFFDCIQIGHSLNTADFHESAKILISSRGNNLDSKIRLSRAIYGNRPDIETAKYII